MASRTDGDGDDTTAATATAAEATEAEESDGNTDLGLYYEETPTSTAKSCECLSYGKEECVASA